MSYSGPAHGMPSMSNPQAPFYGGMDNLFADGNADNLPPLPGRMSTSTIPDGINPIQSVPVPAHTPGREQGQSVELDRLSLSFPLFPLVDNQRDNPTVEPRVDGGADPAFFNQCMQIGSVYSPAPIHMEEGGIAEDRRSNLSMSDSESRISILNMLLLMLMMMNDE